MEESLPSITGNISSNQRNGYEGGDTHGVFSFSSYRGVFYPNDAMMDMLSGVAFDASLSSSVYQDNAHVRPLSLVTMFLMKY